MGVVQSEELRPTDRDRHSRSKNIATSLKSSTSGNGDGSIERT